MLCEWLASINLRSTPCGVTCGHNGQHPFHTKALLHTEDHCLGNRHFKATASWKSVLTRVILQVLPSNSQLSYTRQKTLLLPSQLQQFIMQALSSATGLATQRKPSLVSAVRSMIKELLEELLLIFLKFKAWLTPGTADDKAEDAGDALKAKLL